MKAKFKVFFGDLKVGKKTILPLEIKGNLTDKDKLALMNLAQQAGYVVLSSAQSELDDYDDYEDEDETITYSRQGLTYTLNNGAVEVDKEQLTIKEVVESVEKLEGEKPLEVDVQGEIINKEPEKPKKMNKKQKEAAAANYQLYLEGHNLANGEPLSFEDLQENLKPDEPKDDLPF